MFPLESKLISNEVRTFRLSDVVGCSPGRLVGLGKKYFFPNMLVLTPFLRAITECTNGAMCDVRISF